MERWGDALGEGMTALMTIGAGRWRIWVVVARDEVEGMLGAEMGDVTLNLELYLWDD